MNAPSKPKAAETVEDVLSKLDRYEQWRPQLIAFYRHESPWMRQKLENLERGDPLTADDMHTIDGIIAAIAAQKVAA